MLEFDRTELPGGGLKLYTLQMTISEHFHFLVRVKALFIQILLVKI